MDDNKYYYSGYNKFKFIEVSKIYATNPKQAKEMLKERGLCSITLWGESEALSVWGWPSTIVTHVFRCYSLNYKDENKLIFSVPSTNIAKCLIAIGIFSPFTLFS
ncbi:MAG: hypothetical protein K9M57_10905, partial [Phycisphaerae bacterium]|nr:hypothetical protein [Phycisphaerae bacterium]